MEDDHLTMTINKLLDTAHVWAVVGLGNNPDRPAYHVAKELLRHGKRVVPIHPSAVEVLGQQGYGTIAEARQAVGALDVVDVFVSSKLAGKIADEAIASGAKAVWFQLGVIDEVAALRVKEAGLDMVMNRCPAIEWDKRTAEEPPLSSVHLSAVCFDFDGVLVESVRIKTEAFGKLFEATHPPPTVEQIKNFSMEHEGLSRMEKLRLLYRDLFREPLGEEVMKDMCDAYSALVEKQVVEAPEVRGCEECLLELSAAKVKLFIVSGTPEEELRRVVRARGMEMHFTDVFGSPMSKSDIIGFILSTYHLLPREVIMVGDAEADLVASQKTGVSFVARKTKDTEDLWRRVGVERAVEDMREFLQLVDFRGLTVRK